jgi:hypothetical protein
MDRQKLLLILGALGIAGALVAVLMLLANLGSSDPEPTPEPTVTIDTGGTLAPTATPEETPDPTESIGWQDGHVHYPGDGHDHDHGPVTDCESGPMACEGDEAEAPILRNTDDDLLAADAVKGKMLPFAMQWARVTEGESVEARAARLRDAYASEDVARQMTALARAETAQTQLTATTNPMKPNRTLFLGRESGYLVFQVTLDVDAWYTQVDGSGSFRVVGGQLYVSVSNAGVIERVVEDFPTLREMR